MRTWLIAVIACGASGCIASRPAESSFGTLMTAGGDVVGLAGGGMDLSGSSCEVSLQSPLGWTFALTVNDARQSPAGTFPLSAKDTVGTYSAAVLDPRGNEYDPVGDAIITVSDSDAARLVGSADFDTACVEADPGPYCPAGDSGYRLHVTFDVGARGCVDNDLIPA
jgi:hypothetical protein